MLVPMHSVVWKTRLQHRLVCVKWDAKHCSCTHGLVFQLAFLPTITPGEVGLKKGSRSHLRETLRVGDTN